MSIIESIILGLIQGLTEFIPVSSSGHLLLAHEILGTSGNTLAFDVALHVGTLLALLIYFRKDLWILLINLFENNEHGKLARIIAIATIPAIVIGFLFEGFIDENLRTTSVTALTLAVVGVLMIIVDKTHKSTKEIKITEKKGLLVGLAQATALIPGVSRSGATITMGVFAGMSRKQAAKFSFLLATPIIAGSALGVLVRDYQTVDSNNWQLFAGMLAAFISGILAIKILLGVIEKIGLTPFGIYRIALALIVLVVMV